VPVEIGEERTSSDPAEASGLGSPEGGGPRPPDSLPRVWNLPVRNPGFSGRDGLLVAVRARLLAGDRAVVHALRGMGGVGKTQLAAEYAHRFVGSYDLAWWIDAERGGLIGDQFAALGIELGCIEPGAEMDVVRAAVLAELRERKRWLLIFDDAENPAVVIPWLPGGGHVLITSRESGWDEIAAQIEVDLLTRSESIEILRSRVSGLTEADASELAEELGDLPLGIMQAVGFMAETGISTAAEYLRILRTQARKIMAQRSPVTHPKSLTAITQLIVDRLAVEDPVAAALARICAFLAPDLIPEYFFTAPTGELPAELEARVTDPLAWRQTLAGMTRQSLARVDHRGIQMHRLTQAILRDSLAAGEAALARSRAEAILVASAPRDTGNPVSWPRWAQLMPHVLAANPATSGNPKLRKLACWACSYLIARGDIRLAHDLASDLHEKWLEKLGGDNEDAQGSAHYLACAFREMGNYIAARDLDQGNLNKRRQILGEDDLDTLESATNLAIDLRLLGEVEAARDLDQSNLDKRRQMLGEDDPLTMSAANNLALDLCMLGEVEAARALDQVTLDRRRRLLGEDHPNTLISSYNLAIDLCVLGEVKAASEIARDNLERRRRILGDDHPRTLQSANNYGFFILPHNPEVALSFFAMASRSRNSGGLITLANTVLTLHLLGRNEDALALGSSGIASDFSEADRWMWLLGDDHKLQLGKITDVYVYLEELKRHIDVCSGTPAPS
jgi:NB-ARC domain/Tetratricopeptide repeat